MSDRVNSRLYKIKDIVTENVNVDDFIRHDLVEKYREDTGNEFSEIVLKQNISDAAFSERLFVLGKPEKEPSWLEFLKSIALNEDDLRGLEIKNSSFILFIYTENRLYAIAKGYFGRYMLRNYLDESFGLEVLSKLIDKNSTEIRKIQQRAVFGSELAAERFFREKYSLSYEDDFGLIYRTLLASIDEEDFSKLGIVKKRDDIKKISINGSQSLLMSTNFDFSELVNRIVKIEELLQTEGIKLNQFNVLSNAELSLIKEHLNEKILELAYTSFHASENLDFYHPDIFDYLNAIEISFDVQGDTEIIPLGQSFGFIPVISRLVEQDKIDSSSEEAFYQSLRECRGSFILSEDEAHENYRSLAEWISGEVEFDGRKYFRFDNLWYTFEDSFDEYLNKFFENLDFSDLTPDEGLKVWDINVHSTEGRYNDSFMGDESYIVGDTVKLDFLELTDLIRVTEDEIFLYHVKKGLGRDLRVLSNQVINAARKIRSILTEADDESLRDYYDKIASQKYKSVTIEYTKTGVNQELNKEEFVSFFKERKVSFVFAFSSSSNLTVQQEIIATNSRIAKLSILYCIRDMRVMDFDYLIERINLING